MLASMTKHDVLLHILDLLLTLVIHDDTHYAPLVECPKHFYILFNQLWTFLSRLKYRLRYQKLLSCDIYAYLRQNINVYRYIPIEHFEKMRATGVLEPSNTVQ